jgi:hypothetical protein
MNIIIIRFVNFHQDSSAKDRWIGAYSIGLTFLGKLGCSRKKKKKIVSKKSIIINNNQ